jgi:ABC-type branched-subunit amino acid transport system substrate-binding protein
MFFPLINIIAVYPINALTLTDKLTISKSRDLQDQQKQTLNIAALVDTTEYFAFSADIFKFTTQLINNHTDGWYDDILVDTTIKYVISDPKCSEEASIHAYYKAKAALNGNVDAVIGLRCSSGAVATGWVTTEENVLQVTTATSSKLSDKSIYPFSSRLGAPADASGEVGALVAMLQGFGWERVSIIYTELQNSEDYITEFQKLWYAKGFKIAWSESITVKNDDTLDEASLQNALKNIDEKDPSRVILLVAYNTYAYQILKTAWEQDFRKESIWVGSSAWVGREKPEDIDFNIPSLSGYIGVTPFRNRDMEYTKYFSQFDESKTWFNGESPDYSAEYLIDSILAVAKAYDSTPTSLRNNVSVVSSTLRSLVFDGVSGPVSFTKEGDRAEPKFSIYNMQSINGISQWVLVGSVETDVKTFDIPKSTKICFAVRGCNIDLRYPSEDYPTSNWIIPTLVSVGVTLLILSLLLVRSTLKQRILQKNMSEIQKKIEAMQRIDSELVNLDDTVEAARIRKAQLIQERVLLQDKPINWSDSQSVIVNVAPHDEKYWAVLKELQSTMPDAYISSLWRVQNMSLWTYYCFHKERLAMNNIPHNEKNVWHGTSVIDPAIIYHDKQDGFMMQYSQNGLWG